MWHLKTKVGVFWVVPISEDPKRKKFFLGVNNEELGVYDDAEQAARDVRDGSTGYYRWDSQPKRKAPEHIEEWENGEPKDWR